MKVKEIAVISGKGGTGKTTLTASLIPYLNKTVIADCDVDAPDLHILLKPVEQSRENFSGLKKAIIDKDQCINCGLCMKHCKFKAVVSTDETTINPMKCEGCGVCSFLCPVDAISMNDALTGEVFKGDTVYGPMIHARLVPGEETSGKLVSQVRAGAVKAAEEKGWNKVIIDGSPGIGCNVISSITGADKVIIVTEPSRSGLHDLKRVMEIAERFSGDVYTVINKYDLAKEMSREIEEFARKRNAPVVLKIPFDKKLVKAITEKEIPSLAEKELFSNIGWQNFVSLLEGE